MPDQTYNLSGGFKPTIKRFADLSGPDFFPTPRWATFALVDNEKFSGNVWECACGDGAMSRVLKRLAVRSSARIFSIAVMVRAELIFFPHHVQQII